MWLARERSIGVREELRETRPLQIAGQTLRHPGELREGRQEVEPDDGLVAPRALGDSRPSNQEGNANPAFTQPALAAAQEGAPSPTALAVVRGVDHDRRLAQPSGLDRREQSADAVVEILGDRGSLHVLLVAPAPPLLDSLERRGARVLGIVQGVEGELCEERPPVFHGLAHEGVGPLDHPEDVHRVRVLVRGRVLVAGVTVVDVVAVLSRPPAAEVPLAEVRRRVAGAAEHFGDGHLFIGEHSRGDRRDQAVTVFRRHRAGGLRPVERCRILAGLDPGSRWRADGCSRVGLREAQSVTPQRGDVRGTDALARGSRQLRVHRSREPRPALVVGEQQNDVGPGWDRGAGWACPSGIGRICVRPVGVIEHRRQHKGAVTSLSGDHLPGRARNLMPAHLNAQAVSRARVRQPSLDGHRVASQDLERLRALRLADDGVDCDELAIDPHLEVASGIDLDTNRVRHGWLGHRASARSLSATLLPSPSSTLASRPFSLRPGIRAASSSVLGAR